MESENKITTKNVETYAGDISKAIEHNGGGSFIKKIIQQEEENEAEKEKFSPETKRNNFFLLIGGILVALAVLVIFLVFIFRQQIFTVVVPPQYASIIFTDQNRSLAVDGLTKDKIEQMASVEVNATNVKSGGVEGMYFTENKKIIGFRRFTDLIQGNISSDTLSLINDNFLTGIVNGETKNLFILLQVRSFTDVLPGMKAWENKMFSDLHGFFGIDITPETSYLLTKNFEDGIIANKNARILRDNDGKIVLMYVFLNDTSVIITNSEGATDEVILRLASSQIKK